jgi:hypothetical protein
VNGASRPALTKITKPTRPSTIFQVLSEPIVGTANVNATVAASVKPPTRLPTARGVTTAGASFGTRFVGSVESPQ